MSDYTIIVHYQPPEPIEVEALHVFALSLFVAHADASVRVSVVQGKPSEVFEDFEEYDLEEGEN